jgi:hypothetical protein
MYIFHYLITSARHALKLPDKKAPEVNLGEKTIVRVLVLVC